MFSSFFFYSLSLVTFSNLNLVLFRFHVSEKSLLFFVWREEDEKGSEKKISNFLMKIKKKKENLYNKNF